MKQFFLISAITAFVLCSAGATQACPSCFASSKANALQAYYVSVAFMVVLPFGMVGGVIFWLRRKQQQHANAQHRAFDSQA